jgi:hypothetical protein
MPNSESVIIDVRAFEQRQLGPSVIAQSREGIPLAFECECLELEGIDVVPIAICAFNVLILYLRAVCQILVPELCLG